MIGIKLGDDEVSMGRHVDRAPTDSVNPGNDDHNSRWFRALWGQLSQLRRFRDGAIVEAVVWPNELVGTALIKHIALTAVTRHMRATSPSSSTVGTLQPMEMPRSPSTAEVENLLPSPPSFVKDDIEIKGKHFMTILGVQSTRQLFARAVQTLDGLRKLLLSCELAGMPLQLESLTGTCPELRYTSLVPPFPHPLVGSGKELLRTWAGQRVTRILPALSVIANLRRSSKWPCEPEALRCTRDAMLIRLCESLQHSHQVVYDCYFVFVFVLFFE